MRLRFGDITTVGRGYILQQVNCQNTMRSGVAKAIYEKWPVVKKEYHDRCYGSLSCELLGQTQVVEVVPDTLYVVNLFGQETYGRLGKHTRYDALDDSLQFFFEQVWRKRVMDVHHPLIGSGLGGGHWPVVREIIKHRVRTETTLWLLPEQPLPCSASELV